ncbi:MAG: hypothetical protein IKB44_05005, partial [Clostridia bacterium]|nr:hypothetical protein [Clostridia bacterium]
MKKSLAAGLSLLSCVFVLFCLSACGDETPPSATSTVPPTEENNIPTPDSSCEGEDDIKAEQTDEPKDNPNIPNEPETPTVPNEYNEPIQPEESLELKVDSEKETEGVSPNDLAMKGYYQALKESRTVYFADKDEVTTLSKYLETRQKTKSEPFFFSEFASVDFGQDGVFELILAVNTRSVSGQIILYYRNGTVCITERTYDELRTIDIFGVCKGKCDNTYEYYYSLTPSNEGYGWERFDYLKYSISDFVFTQGDQTSRFSTSNALVDVEYFYGFRWSYNHTPSAEWTDYNHTNIENLLSGSSAIDPDTLQKINTVNKAYYQVFAGDRNISFIDTKEVMTLTEYLEIKSQEYGANISLKSFAPVDFDKDGISEVVVELLDRKKYGQLLIYYYDGIVYAKYYSYDRICELKSDGRIRGVGLTINDGFFYLEKSGNHDWEYKWEVLYLKYPLIIKGDTTSYYLTGSEFCGEGFYKGYMESYNTATDAVWYSFDEKTIEETFNTANFSKITPNNEQLEKKINPPSNEWTSPEAQAVLKMFEDVVYNREKVVDTESGKERYFMEG